MKLKYLAVGFLTIIIAIVISLYVIFNQTFVTSLVYKGQNITINRDANNIAEIHAPNYQAALYSLGYVSAEDRLFQLAFKRLAGKGTLSKYLGSKSIEIDKMFRQLNLYQWGVLCAERFRRQNFTEYTKYEAYTKGINDYVKSIKFKPLQFYLIGLQWQEWTMADTFMAYKLVKWSVSFGRAQEYARSQFLNKFSKEQVDSFIPYELKYWLNGKYATRSTIVRQDQIPEDLIKISQHLQNQQQFDPVKVSELLNLGFYQYLDINQRGSNSWAISGKYTESGHALLANDPHLDSALPGEFYQVRMFYFNDKGQQIYMIGGTFVGVFTWIGKSPYYSQTVTVNYLDSQDLFKETVQQQKYLVDGVWKNLKSRTQIIYVKNAQPIEYKVYQTHRGPLISLLAFRNQIYKITQPISLSWVGFTTGDYMSVAAYARAPQISTYSQLIYFLQETTDYLPILNIIYITKDDHIGYQAVGAIPLRKNHNSGMYVKDGSVSHHDWVHFVQGKNKLHIEDPERGYICSSNNPPVRSKYFNGIYDAGVYTARADRIEHLLKNQINEGRKIGLQFVQKLQVDTVDAYCLQVVQGMKKKLAAEPQKYKYSYSIFQNFDCNFDGSSTIASYYLVFLQNIFEQINPEGKNFTIVLSNFVPHYQYLYSFLLKQHTAEQIEMLNNSMTDTISQLKQFFKSDNPKTYNYGTLHTDLMVHRPFSGAQAIKLLFQSNEKGYGNLNTVNIAAMYRFHLKDYRANHHTTFRMIINYHQNSYWIVDGGTSEKFYSKHYKDQLGLMFAGKYLLMDSWNRTTTVY